MGVAFFPFGNGNAQRPAPDYLGAVFVSGALASLVLAITEGPRWGWTSTGVLGALGVAVILGAIFLNRCAHHPEPVLDLTLFHERTFSVSNIATFLYSMGFFAMLLGNILFLTGVLALLDHDGWFSDNSRTFGRRNHCWSCRSTC
ncbi:MAG: hypothetical protein WDO06_07000 [Actinomycetota bacterium]